MAEESAEERAEKAEERAEEAEERAEERREGAEKTTAGRRAKGAREQTEETENNSSAPHRVTLRVKGDPETRFSGTCSVGEEEHALSGQVPQSYHYKLNGQELECRIRKQKVGGNLKVILTGRGVYAVQQLGSTGTLHLTYDGKSISSSVSSSSSSLHASSSSSSSHAIQSSWTSSES